MIIKSKNKPYVTLRDALEQTKGHYIKIAAGSGYFYASLNDYETEKLVKKISDRYQKSYVRYLRKANYHKKHFDTIWLRKINQALSILHKRREDGETNQTDLERLEELKEQREKDRETTDFKIVKYSKLLEEREGFLDRRVKEIYKSILGDGIIIIIEGEEIGDFWTKEEYERRKT